MCKVVGCGIVLIRIGRFYKQLTTLQLTTMNILLHPTYFPSIANYVAMLKADTVMFEVHDNYQKQTYRNRAFIYAANGKLLLNIPVHHTQNNRQLYKDIKIAYTSNWQSLHWKSIQSAYYSSPFFEYYADELQPLFEKQALFLLDFNMKCFEVIATCLQLKLHTTKSATFEKHPENATDLRILVNNRKELTQDFEPYKQVFDDKHGFLSNLSILDLLFNEGPMSVSYLKSQNILY